MNYQSLRSMQRLLFTLSFMLTLPLLGLTAQEISVVTEEYPPYNYTEGGQITGLSTEVVKAALDISGLDYEMKALPWARAYATAKDTPNTLIFSISRSEERENLFTWIDIVAPTKFSVFARKGNNYSVNSYDDMKKYSTGTNRNDIVEQLLKSKGFTRAHLDSTSGQTANMTNFRKMMQGRIDFWPAADAVVFFTAQQAGYANPEEILQRVLPIPELSEGGFYIAANPETDPAVIEKIKEALKQMRDSGKYQEILANWGM